MNSLKQSLLFVCVVFTVPQVWAYENFCQLYWTRWQAMCVSNTRAQANDTLFVDWFEEDCSKAEIYHGESKPWIYEVFYFSINNTQSLVIDDEITKIDSKWNDRWLDENHRSFQRTRTTKVFNLAENREIETKFEEIVYSFDGNKIKRTTSMTTNGKPSREVCDYDFVGEYRK